MLRKHVPKFWMQWDTYLHGMPWAYRNTSHSYTRKNLHSYCMVSTAGILRRINFTDQVSTKVSSDYREKLVLSLSSAQELASKAKTEAQTKQKIQYNKNTSSLWKWGNGYLSIFPRMRLDSYASYLDHGMEHTLTWWSWYYSNKDILPWWYIGPGTPIMGL